MKKIIALLLACVLIFTFAACGDKNSDDKASGKPYADALDVALKTISGKPMSESEIRGMYPEGLYDMMASVGLDFDTYYEGAKESIEEVKEALENKFGDDYKTSYKITADKKLSDDDAEDMVSDYAEQGWFDADKLKEIYEVTLDFTVKGSEDNQTFEIIAWVMNYDGAWYTLDMDVSEMDAYVG